MNIIVEGPDSSGKTTLIHHLLNSLKGFTLKEGEGPPKFPGEITERCQRYLKMDQCVMDRHPAISHPIYDKFRETPDPLPRDLVFSFYLSNPLIIYCYGKIGQHQIKDYDSVFHQRMVKEKDKQIRLAYLGWAQHHVPTCFWCAAGQQKSIERITNLVRERINHDD